VPRGGRQQRARVLRERVVGRDERRQERDEQPAADDEPIHNGHCCSLLELSDARCRWPISTPGADDFRFCGNTPVEGLPYCAGHTRLAYRPGYRPRSARG